jgi:hypothetical protein
MVVDFDDFDANHRFLGFVSALTHLPTGRHRLSVVRTMRGRA